MVAQTDAIVVKSLMSNALNSCAKRLGLEGREQVIEALRRGDCGTCEYLRDELAKEISQLLGSTDSTIQRVYCYNPEYATGTGDGNRSPTINLVVWVSQKTAALSSLVTSIASGLAEETRQLACPKANALCCALDVQLVDDGQVKGRIGYGALVHSLHVRPTEMWRRSAK